MQGSTIQYFKLNKPSLTSKNFHRFHDNGKGMLPNSPSAFELMEFSEAFAIPRAL